MASPFTWSARTSARQVAEVFASQLKNRTVILTGPSKEGVGLGTALALASQQPTALILAGGTISKLEASREEVLKEFPDVDVRLVQCDLSNVESVKNASQIINGYKENVDIVINNAAVMDTPFELTRDGFELQLASNYLGHFVLVQSIMPKILAGINKRVVMVSSVGHAYGGMRREDPNFEKGDYTPNLAYGQSKTACNLYAIDLTNRYRNQGLPGGIESPLQKYWTLEHKMNMNKMYDYDAEGHAIMSENGPWKTPDQGSATSLRAALDPSLADKSGAYLDDYEIATQKAASWATDPAEAARLFKWTNKLLETDF